MIAFAAMTPDHLDAVCDIESVSHHSPWTRGNFIDSLDSGHAATVMQEDGDCEEEWLPIIDWGCAEFSLIDCDNDFLMISLYEGNFHPEDYTFETLLERWINGELPDLPSGGFHLRKDRT